MNAPFTWPNSSLSSRLSGIAAQLIATNGPLAPRLARWSALATSSLPVPLSPVMSTVVSVSATRATRSYIFFIAALVAEDVVELLGARRPPCAAASPLRGARGACSGALDRERDVVHLERLRDEVVGAGADGRDRGSMLPNAVITTTGRSGLSVTTRRQSSRPLVSGKFKSVTMTSVLRGKKRQSVGGRSARRGIETAAPERLFEQLAHRAIVIDNEDSSLHRGCAQHA